MLENVYPIPHAVKEGGIARLTSYRAEPVRFVRLKTLGLAVSITVALAAVGAAIFAAWPGASWDQQVAFVYILCAVLGAAAAQLLWDKLVEKAPVFSSSALQSIGERGHEERGVPQRRLPWRLLGLVLGACIGVLVGGLFGGPIGGVVGAAAGYGLGGRRA